MSEQIILQEAEQGGLQIQITKGNLTIRSARVEDAELLTKWWNDGRVMAHAGFPNGLNQSLEQTIAQVKQNEVHISQRCIIEVDNVRVGEMNYGIEENTAEVGIKICETAYQNHGNGTSLMSMLIDFLFCNEELNKKARIKKIILDTNLKNQRAQHVYEKIGFRRLRVNQNAWKDQLGEWQSSVDYEMTREQYEQRSGCMIMKNGTKESEGISKNGVRFVEEEAEKAEIAEKILYDLPDWFGLPESTKNYIEESRKMPFWAYFEEDKAVGFIALKETGTYTAEIFVMGILKAYHRKGIGTKLFEAFHQYAKEKKYEYMQVKTVDEGHYEEYDRTRMFYERIGFRKLECFPTLWDEWNPCLVMIRSI